LGMTICDPRLEALRVNGRVIQQRTVHGVDNEV
jgi:hypothetical protein